MLLNFRQWARKFISTFARLHIIKRLTLMYVIKVDPTELHIAKKEINPGMSVFLEWVPRDIFTKLFWDAKKIFKNWCARISSITISCGHFPFSTTYDSVNEV